MPAKAPSPERIRETLSRFQLVEEETRSADKERYFRLPYEAALAAVDAELSKTAYRLWIYLSVNYPFGDRDVDLPSQTELAIRLSVSRQSVNIAAAELQAVGLWDFWPDRWKGRNLKGFNPAKEESVKESRQVSKKSDTLSTRTDTECQQKSTGYQKNLTPCQQKQTPPDLKLPSSTDFSDHNTIQTYTDFKNTLSEEEREKFLSFCKELISNFSQPIHDIEAWLASITKAGENRWEVYYQKFSARKEEETKKMTRKTGRELLEEFHAELEQKRQQAAEILQREQEQATTTTIARAQLQERNCFGPFDGTKAFERFARNRSQNSKIN